ncbi:carbonic anhydrase [Lysinibacillus sp. PLM2]|nr:carbonic anhydrase [Lysinibacillus sp. PLM2]
MSRVKYYSFLLIIQIVIAIIVYVSFSNVPKEINNDQKESLTTQVYWSYEAETGPTEWETIDPAFSACGNGSEQSPINITDEIIAPEKKNVKIELKYEPTKFLLENNGYTIQINDPTGKNKLLIDDEEYTLEQIYFHNPSEHQINEEVFNMEGHLFHKNKEGKIAVVGVFIKEGKINTELANLWSELPEEKTSKAIEIEENVNLLEVLPEVNNIYLYTGSLTTPPCTQGITWILLEEPVEMSSQQIEVFAEIYPQNNRPVQELNGRSIYKINLK